jgi:hypothetical protein
VTPFLQLRIWFRRASAASRASAVVGAAAFVAVIAWIAVPSPKSGSSVAVGSPGAVSASGGSSSASSPAAAGSAASGQGTGALGAGAAVSPSSGSGGPSASGSATRSSSGGQATNGATSSGPTQISGIATPSGQGCTKRGTLKIGVVVPTGAGGSINSVIGSPPQSQEEADYAAVFDDVNKSGGVDCNNLVGDYALADLTNPSSAQQGCLQFQQDKVFAVLGGFEPLFSDDCLLQAHLPTFDELPIPQGDVSKYYPYYFSDYPTYERLYNNFVKGANQLGYFSAAHHFAKVGIFYEDCTPEIQQALVSDLAAVGLSGSKVDSYDLGCSSAFAPPNAIEQAVLKFKTEGVTTAIISDDIADGQNISNISNSQNFRPQWILPDYGEVAVQNSANEHPNASEFNGALAVTANQYGAIGSNLPLTPGSQKCNQIMISHGLPGVYQSPDAFGGAVCSEVWMFVTALSHDPTVSPTGIAAGLQAAGSFETSFPIGPNSTSAPGNTTGGQFWRTDTYSGSCQCWQVASTNWNPSFS